MCYKHVVPLNNQGRFHLHHSHVQLSQRSLSSPWRETLIRVTSLHTHTCAWPSSPFVSGLGEATGGEAAIDVQRPAQIGWQKSPGIPWFAWVICFPWTICAEKVTHGRCPEAHLLALPVDGHCPELLDVFEHDIYANMLNMRFFFIKL